MKSESMQMKLLSVNSRICELPLPGNKLKWSIWNDIIPVDDEKCVLFNTVSRNAILTTRNLSQYHIESLSGQDCRTLYELGFMVSVSRDEMTEQLERFNRGKDDFSYLDLTILVTHDCQMRCTYCFEGNKEKITMNASTGQAIVKLLKNYASVSQKVRVTWFGGEPLLAYCQIKRLTEELISFCRANDMVYSADMTTNGYALTPERCEELIGELMVKRYIITMDGPAGIHNHRRPLITGYPTFKRIWSNICTLVEHGAHVTIRMTIDRENRSYIPEFLNMLAKSRLKGRVSLSFNRTIDFNFTPDIVKSNLYGEREWIKEEWELIQMAHHLGLWSYQFPHAAPEGGCLRRGDFTIAANGLIYKCLDTVGDKRWICGDITVPDGFHTPEWYQQWLKWTPLNNDNCKYCVLLPLCNGGCPHNALYVDKRHGTNLQCPDWKANYRNQIIEIAKMYEKENI